MRIGAFVFCALVAASAQAQDADEARTEDAVLERIDRIAVRWHARETGGVQKPQFITARELAFEARIEALGEGTKLTAPFTDKHARAAAQRHITEVMLASLPVDPPPTPKQVAVYAEAARGILAQRIANGDAALGAQMLDEARRAESITNEELDALLRRRARASWYLDKMIAPMLTPSELDLREVHRRGETPYTDASFADAEPQLLQWYVSTRLAAALDRYFRNARSRVKVFAIADARAR